MTKLRIGYVPEHFSTPLFFAQKHFNLEAEFIPFPTGTGALANALKEADRTQGIDVAIGLTEGFVADLAKAKTSPGYSLVGTYVESPLCWAISTGAKRDEIKTISDLKDSRVGVSRIGSGSYVMSFVLADHHGWLNTAKQPFEVVPIGDFAALRKSVGPDKSSDFFMWEHFTTKNFWDNGELKRIDEIYTPWPSWVIAARDTASGEISALAEKIDLGIQHYRDNSDEAMKHITTTMHYSHEDALEWAKTVRFVDNVYGVSAEMVNKAITILQKASVLDSSARGSDQIISVSRNE